MGGLLYIPSEVTPTSAEGDAALGIERRDGVVTLTLNRPERRNAIDVPLWGRLAGVLGEIAHREEDRVVILTGAGGTFSSGGDLSGAGAAEPEPGSDPREGALRAMRDSVGVTCLALHELPKPTVAAVEGTAAGAGANLAFGCDLVVAAEGARFGQVFVRRGLPVDSGGSWLLPRLVGLHRAKELAMLGDWLPAPDALRLGLANRVVPDGEALGASREWASRLAASSPRALGWIKANLNAAFDRSFEETLDAEARGIVDSVGSPEFREAMKRFAPKK